VENTVETFLSRVTSEVNLLVGVTETLPAGLVVSVTRVGG
jgi:hypothetical protein